MIPTVIDDDREAAAAINRRTLSGYVALPNYRNYWKAAGYEEEMTAIEDALAAGERDKVATFMTDNWLSDCTLYGSAAEVRDGVDAWFDAGVKTPIVVMSSTKGGQFVALQELFDASLVGAQRRARAHQVAIALRAVDATDRRPVLRAPQR